MHVKNSCSQRELVFCYRPKMRPKMCCCRKFSSQGAFPTTFWKSLDSRVANILEPPQNASENALMSQIRFPTIELGYSPLQCKDFFFFFAWAQKNFNSQGADISLPPQNVTKNAPVSQFWFSTNEMWHSPPQRQEICFSHARKKSWQLATQHFITTLEHDSKRAGVATSFSNHRIRAFPTTMPRIYFLHAHEKSWLPRSRHFKAALDCNRKRAGVAKSVPNHRIGAFPTAMQINIYFACARKILAPGEPTFCYRPRMRP